MTLGNAAQNKTFYNGKNFDADNRNGTGLKDFVFEQKFSAKEFSTKEFSTRDNSTRDAKFATADANTKGAHVIPNATKNFDTKSEAVKDARENGKNYSTGDYTTAEFQARGKTPQKMLDAEYVKGPKSIDDVRLLLNKNK